MHIKISISAFPSGTFWTNCTLVCPDGYYGMFCKETCDCKTSECDKAIGCPKKDISTYPTETNNSTHDDYDHIAYA